VPLDQFEVTLDLFLVTTETEFEDILEGDGQ